MWQLIEIQDYNFDKERIIRTYQEFERAKQDLILLGDALQQDIDLVDWFVECYLPSDVRYCRYEIRKMGEE